MLLLKDRAEFFAHLPSGIVAEIGVQFGDNAQTILDNCAVQRLYLIDCWEYRTGSDDPTNVRSLTDAYEYVKWRFKSDSRVEILKAYSLEAAKRFNDEMFDWVYLDGDHTFEAVRLDIKTWWPKVKMGGFLCGHDYIDEKYSKKYSYIQVREAVDELGLELYALTDEKYGSWAIRRYV